MKIRSELSPLVFFSNFNFPIKVIGLERKVIILRYKSEAEKSLKKEKKFYSQGEQEKFSIPRSFKLSWKSSLEDRSVDPCGIRDNSWWKIEGISWLISVDADDRFGQSDQYRKRDTSLTMTRDGAATIHKILGRDEPWPEMLYCCSALITGLAGSSVFLVLSWFPMFQIFNYFN